ncbi:septum formation initiator [Treponema phagedenis F0421]|nr:septum formation initiator [Treponema phagedenis F0421]TYT77900.1 septum formation initiator family protein [Treponema phagedenis]
MKLYLKIIFPVFVAVGLYGFLSLFFGQKSFFAMKQMQMQRDALKYHVETLAETTKELGIIIDNLSFDQDTIEVYANQLGYVRDGEFLIKPTNFSGSFTQQLTAGTSFKITKPYTLSDDFCKSLAASAGIIILILEMLFGIKK